MNGETIIYFGPEPWEGMWRNRHQLMSRLAADNRVIYVEPAVMLRPAMRSLLRSGRDGSRSLRGKLTTHESGVRIYESPAFTPLTGRQPFKDFSVRIYMRTLFRKAGIDKSCRPIIWLSRPQMSDYIGKAREKLAIYHVVDEYTAYTGVDAATREWLLAHERAALEKADAVIVVTPALMDAKISYNRNTYLVPNAVNYAAYATPVAQAPEEMASIASPIVGFAGLVSARLDLDLLLAAATQRPDWSFVFVGSIDRSECGDRLDQLASLDNVHLLGVRPVEKMPAYLQSFDICTIPYAADDSAANASPLKLYEYAAARKPIVSTDFPAARDFSGHLFVAKSTAEFIDACERAVAMPVDDARLEENQRFASHNTWEDRLADVVGIIDRQLTTD